MSIITSIINGKLNSINELQNIVENLIDYCNKCPNWSFKGYSPNEMSKFTKENKLGKVPSHAPNNPSQRSKSTNTNPDASLSLDVMPSLRLWEALHQWLG